MSARRSLPRLHRTLPLTDDPSTTLPSMSRFQQSLSRIAYRTIGFLMAWSIPMGLGCAVIAIAVHLLHREAAVDESLYEAGQLMLLNVDPDEHTGASMWIARLFAVFAVLLFGIEVVLQFGGRGIDRLRLWYRKNFAGSHAGKRVLVIGSDDHAADFAKSLFRSESQSGLGTQCVTHLCSGAKRTLHPSDLSNPVLSMVHPNLGPECLRDVGIDRYTDVVVIESQDSVALETLAGACEALHGPMTTAGGAVRTMPTIRVRIQSPELCATLRRRNWVPNSALGHVRIWCPDDLSARRALRDANLDGTWSFAKPGGRSSIVMLGFGSANRALAARAIGQMHHVDETPADLHVFDEHADRSWSLFEEAWPGAKDEKAVRRQLHAADAHAAETRALIRDLAGDRTSNLLIGVSIGDLDANLALASAIIDDLSASIEQPRAVILIRQRGVVDADEIARFAKSGDRGRGIQVLAWGDVRSSQSPDDVLEDALDRVAKEVHAAYLRGEQERDPATWEERTKQARTDEFSSLREWGELWPFLRDDNRNNAEFTARRLRAIGLELVDEMQRGQTEVKPGDLTHDKLTTLAQLEHRRWMVNRLMNGWRLGAKKDPSLKTHPDLVEWDNLSEEARGKDFRVVIGSEPAARTGKPGYEVTAMNKLVGAGKRLVKASE